MIGRIVPLLAMLVLFVASPRVAAQPKPLTDSYGDPLSGGCERPAIAAIPPRDTGPPTGTERAGGDEWTIYDTSDLL